MQNGLWSDNRVPFEAVGQIRNGEFEVNYLAARGRGASRGSMKKQRTDKECKPLGAVPVPPPASESGRYKNLPHSWIWRGAVNGVTAEEGPTRSL
jgi:hypothetical protein